MDAFKDLSVKERLLNALKICYSHCGRIKKNFLAVQREDRGRQS